MYRFFYFVFVCLTLMSGATGYTKEPEDFAIVVHRDLFLHHGRSLAAEAPPVVIEENLSEIAARPIRIYFARDFVESLSGRLQDKSKQTLVEDLLKLHQATIASFEKIPETERPDFTKFEFETLRPAIFAFTYATLLKKPLIGDLAFGDRTLEDLLRKLESEHLRKQKSKVEKVIVALKLRKINRATIRNTILLSSLAGLTYYFQDKTGLWVIAYVATQELLRDASGGLTGFVRRPLGQLIELFDYRTFGAYEAKLNHLSNEFLQRFPAPKDNSVSTEMLPAFVEIHGMNFAGATPNDQLKNYQLDREEWINIQRVYGQLNTKTQHWGRTLQMAIWEAESAAAHFITTGLHRSETAKNEQTRILDPYVFEIMGRRDLALAERVAMKDELYAYVRELRDAHTALWKDPYLSERKVSMLHERMRVAERGLMKFGVSYMDRERINEQEEIRWEALARVVMGVATNERRLFVLAEANRNLPPGPPVAGAAEMRNGYQNQKLVEEFQIIVAVVLRRMGQIHNEWLDAHIERSKQDEPVACLAFGPVKAIAAE